MLDIVASAAGPHVSITPDILFNLGPVPITNSIVLGIVGYGIVLAVLLWTVKLIRNGSRSRFMHAMIWMFESLFNTVEEVIGSRAKAVKLAPLAITMFLVIMINNWIGLLPVVNSVTYNGAPLFRGLAADLNFTFALAIISMVTVQVWAVVTHGFFGNLKRYFRNPFKDAAGAFEGILELVAEVSRLIALSMRLFGNVFGGEVLLAVIAFITSYAAPISLPAFMLLELFVGAVQAYVFFMLTVVFISLGAAGHGGDHGEELLGEDDPETKKPAVKPQGVANG